MPEEDARGPPVKLEPPAISRTSHNFPINLSIKPLALEGDATDATEAQSSWIEQYGIAGRVWEAVPYLMQYLQPSTNTSTNFFDPPCSIFDGPGSGLSPHILELGSGNGHLGLQHLAPLLPHGSLLVLTDLEEVVPLLERNARSARDNGRISDGVLVDVRALPWGSHESVASVHAKYRNRPFTHIICSDLVYFTELLEPLLKTLIWLTEEDAAHETERTPIVVIFGYKIRAHAKESPFWETLGAFFEIEAVSRDQTHIIDPEDSPPPSPFEENRLLILQATRKPGKTWTAKEAEVHGPLMDHKDGQFEQLIMLKMFRAF